ncbi:MAG: NAD-dependent epimerase/dehydratase family protein [Planctomycetes bacterium]|nr:NAD-dependent epimerase/dehydratase family protein [Planctomycetota bacterium]
MRIAITGSTGFIGGYLTRALAEAGHELRLLIRPGREEAAPAVAGAQPELFIGNLSDAKSLEGFLEGCELLIHLASAHDHLNDEEMRAVNIGGTEALIAEAERCGHSGSSGFEIWVVSSAVIGAPVYSYYRDTKRIQEKLIRGCGINWTSFRPTLVYGEGDMRHTAPLLRKCAEPKGKFLVPHDGKSMINPVHVDDVVDAVMRFFNFDRGVDCCYELAGPQGLPYNQFVDATIAATGGGVRRRNISKAWADRLIFLKGLFTDVTEDRRASAYFMLHHEHNITNAVEELGWTPRSYEEGIREVAKGDWWRA